MPRLGRRGLAAIALASIAGITCAVANASVQMSVGIRYVMPTGTLSDCSGKAQTALNAYLQNVTETPQGSGDWSANGPTGSVKPTATAAVRCYALSSGFEVTFTCAVLSKENPYTADALCLDIAHNFSGKPVTPLATAAPVAAGGCSASNLAGKWTSDNDSKVVLTLTPTGDLTDADGTSGNWIVYNGTVTLTYYGNHTLTLSPDGKHMSGGGQAYTRKC